MNNQEHCPVCGAGPDQIEDKVNSTSAMAVYGPAIHVNEHRRICNYCGSIIESDDGYSDAMTVSERESVKNMIEYVEQNHSFSLGEIEMSLGLSHRSLSKWKNTKTVSAPTLALLRIVRSLPMVIDAAANKFDEGVTLQLLRQTVINKLVNLHPSESSLSGGHFDLVGVASDGDKVRMTGVFVASKAAGRQKTESGSPSAIDAQSLVAA